MQKARARFEGNTRARVMASKYYKCNSDGMDYEEGHYYFEVVNHLTVKQINVYDENMYWATERDGNYGKYDFTDQPEFPEEDIPRLMCEHDLQEISKEAFLSVWEQAQKIKYD